MAINAYRYVVRLHDNGRPAHDTTDTRVLAIFTLAHDACNFLQRYADAHAFAGNPVTGAGYVRHITDATGPFTLRVWHANVAITDKD